MIDDNGRDGSAGFWLLKCDPETYSFDDLQRDKRTVWDGVKNNQAVLYLKKMKKGDQILLYHSGKDKHVAGMGEIVRGPYADPKDKEKKLIVVDVGVKKKLPRPVTLQQIRKDPVVRDLHLVRQSQLSVMPVAEPVWNRLLTMAGL